ncbi:MAG: DUF4198 domain-containing protein [bacterium]
MKKNLFAFFLIICFVFVCLFNYSNKVGAHDLWINMSHHYIPVGGEAIAYLGWGHSYPFSPFLNTERLEKMNLIDPAGKIHSLSPKSENPGIEIKVDKEGTYLVTAELKSGYHTKTTTGYTSKSKKDSKDVIYSSWSEKFAKAIFAGGSTGSDSFKKQVGHSIEIIPLSDPGMLHEGDMLPVKILFKGKPLSKVFVYGTYVGFSTERAFAYTVMADNNGIAKIKMIKSGIWQIMAMHSHSAPDLTECDEYKYVTFLTFEVK